MDSIDTINHKGLWVFLVVPSVIKVMKSLRNLHERGCGFLKAQSLWK